MSETPPPRDPPPPDPPEPDPSAPDPAGPSEDETLIASDWAVRPEGQVVVEQSETETAPPRQRPADLAVAARPAGARARRPRSALLLHAGRRRAGRHSTTATTAPRRRRSSAAVCRTSSGRRRRRRPRRSGTPASRPTWSPCRPTEPRGQVVAQNPAAGKRGAGGLDGAAERRAGSGGVADCRRRPPSRNDSPPATTAPPEPATVPDVVGEELADAARAFDDEGAEGVRPVRAVGRAAGAGRRPGPAGRDRASSRGDTVQVNVSNGPDPAADTQVPDAVGQPQARGPDDARPRRLRGARARARGQPSRSIVSSQSPAAGALIPRGSLVLLYVGVR